jgi:large subunit ribosomal protein L19
MDLITLIEKENEKKDITPFNVGDTVKVYFKIVEGNKERVQAFEGLVIARKNGGVRETFTVRKISFGVGVERTFPVHSPRIEKIEVTRQGDVRRAKLYYIRNLTGKSATRVKEATRKNVAAKVVLTEEEKIAQIKKPVAKKTAKTAEKKAPKAAKVEAPTETAE